MNFTAAILIGILFSIGFIWPLHRLSLKTRRKINTLGFLCDLLVGSLMVSFALSTGTATALISAITAMVGFTAYMSWSKWRVGTQPLWLKQNKSKLTS